MNFSIFMQIPLASRLVLASMLLIISITVTSDTLSKCIGGGLRLGTFSLGCLLIGSTEPWIFLPASEKNLLNSLAMDGGSVITLLSIEILSIWAAVDLPVVSLLRMSQVFLGLRL